jgi:hypothetical protein
MASGLNTKINSYALERGIEFDSTYPTVSPFIGPRTGTNPLGTYTKNSTGNIVWEPTVGPIGGSGSWKLQISTTAATNSYVRGTTVSATELTGLADKNWSTGFWFKLDTIPTGTSLTALGLFQFGDSATGFVASISGTSSSNPAKIYVVQNGIGSITSIHPNALVVNRWYYFAVTRNDTAMRFYLDGTFLFEGYTTSTGTASTLMWGDTSARTFTGSWSISNFYLAPLSVIGPTAISEIWTVGTTSRTVKYYNGTAWVNSSAQKVYNGTAWVDWNAKRFDGTAWVTI